MELISSKMWKRNSIQSLQVGCLALLVALSLSSCLRTRAQMRDESYDREEPTEVRPAEPVRDVEPQGGYAIEELKSEFTRLAGKIEDLERSQKEGIQKSGSPEDIKRLESRLIALEENLAAIQEMVNKTQVSPAALDPSELYKKAMSQYHSQNYEDAVETFAEYLKAPKAKKAEEATFLKAECFYKLKEYKKAIVEYSKFPEKFTKSNHLPEALYKIGSSFELLGMKEDARGFYQELVEKFPKSPEAKKARKKVK